MNVEMTVRVWMDRETKQYVAHALPIDVASHGPTAHDAQTALDEAVRAFIATAAKNGTLREAMEECGYEERGDDWIAPTVLSTHNRRLQALS